MKSQMHLAKESVDLKRGGTDSICSQICYNRDMQYRNANIGDLIAYIEVLSE